MHATEETITEVASSEDDDAKRLDHYDEIQEQAKVVRIAARRWAALKESCASAKKKWEAESSRLVEIVNGDPFEEDEPDEPFQDEEMLVGSDWQSIGVDALAECEVSPKQIGCLLDANLKTLGHLQRLMTAEGTFWAKDVKGIGESAQTAIEDALNTIVCAATSQDEEDVVDPSFVVVPDENVLSQSPPSDAGVDISDV